MRISDWSSDVCSSDLAGRRAPKRPQTPFAIRFHPGATVQVTQTADGMAALLRLPGGTAWQFRCKGGALGIESSVWIDGDGRPVATPQPVVSGEAAPGGAPVRWALMPPDRGLIA